MQETNTPDNRDTSIHGQLANIGFANIGNASPAINQAVELAKFSRGLDDAISNRSADRARQADGRRKLGLGGRVALGLLASATVTNPIVKETASDAFGAVKNIVTSESSSSDMNQNPAKEVITVQPGDTVWDIADAHTDGDVRPLVDELKSQPDAQDGLQPGDKLEVPITTG